MEWKVDGRRSTDGTGGNSWQRRRFSSLFLSFCVVRAIMFTSTGSMDALIMLLFLHLVFVGSLSSQPGTYGPGTKELHVGEELHKETLPLQTGSRHYKIKGLRPSYGYEVKISYPASIPASFSLQLKRENSTHNFNMRRLLNTEKLIFRAGDHVLGSGGTGDSVMVYVQPEGVVAKPHTKDREFIIFNIVCDELTLGIPHKAWWVGILAVLCIGCAFLIPHFLPSYLIDKGQKLPRADKTY